jgi:hypothetical protein
MALFESTKTTGKKWAALGRRQGNAAAMTSPQNSR